MPEMLNWYNPRGDLISEAAAGKHITLAGYEAVYTCREGDILSPSPFDSRCDSEQIWIGGAAPARRYPALSMALRH